MNQNVLLALSLPSTRLKKLSVFLSSPDLPFPFAAAFFENKLPAVSSDLVTFGGCTRFANGFGAVVREVSERQQHST